MHTLDEDHEGHHDPHDNGIPLIKPMRVSGTSLGAVDVEQIQQFQIHSRVLPHVLR